MILEHKKIKSATVSTVSPSICHELMGPDAMILVFCMLSLSQLFHSPLSLSSRGCLVPLHFLPLEWYHLHIREGNGTPLQYSCLETPMDGGARCAAVHGVAKSRTRLSDFTFTHWRRKWQPTPVLLPGKSQGRRSLVGCSPWGRYESDTTERLHFHALEKEMATHSSVLAWRIPGTGESGGLLSMGSHRVGHD